ncbi:MAG: hypothetical protein DRO11_10495, partial [Methanobacteriota archaeon]
MFLLLTGGRRAGKTWVCQKVVETLRKHRYHPAGVITLPISCGDKELGLEAMDVETSERWVLSRANQAMGGPRVGRHSFDKHGLAKAVTTLRKAITKGCDLL